MSQHEGLHIRDKNFKCDYLAKYVYGPTTFSFLGNDDVLPEVLWRSYTNSSPAQLIKKRDKRIPRNVSFFDIVLQFGMLIKSAQESEQSLVLPVEIVMILGGCGSFSNEKLKEHCSSRNLEDFFACMVFSRCHVGKFVAN